MTFLRKLLATHAPASVVLIRLLVGLVFPSEGIQKFLFPESVGAGRFAKIGFSQPEFVAAFVAVFEITCGSVIVAGLLTRLAVIPTIIIMLVAITTTKIPILQDQHCHRHEEHRIGVAQCRPDQEDDDGDDCEDVVSARVGGHC